MESKRVLFLFSLLALGLLSGDASAGIVGGYTPIKDLTDPYVVEMAKFAVSVQNKHATTSGSKLVFVKLVSGQRQVVAGTNYKLVIAAKVAGTNNTDHYEAVVFDKLLENGWTLTSFKKLADPRTVVGGYTPINDLTDPYVVEIGRFAVAVKNAHESSSKNKLVFVEVVAGKKQVVSGINYMLVIKAKVDGSNYVNNYEAIRVLFLFSLLALGLLSGEVASAAVLGGYTPINNLNDPYVVGMAKFAVSEQNEYATSKLVFVKLVSGQKQVVAGTNYKLVIAAKVAGTNNVGNYEAVVFDKLLNKGRTLTSFKKLTDPRPVLGAYTPINDLTDPYVVEIGRFAVAVKNAHESSSKNKLVFVKVVAGKKQVVSGINYKLVIKAKIAGGNYVNNYEAIVYDKLTEKSWTLTSFKPLLKNA
ncbi:hypothetical protein V2J09_012336 [Rumex salicifolius]